VVGSGPVGERATPTSGQDPLSPRWGLASLLARWWPPDTSPAPRPRGCALGVIAPDDVAIVIGGGDLDESIPELSPSNVLFRLVPAHVTFEHDVAVVGRADDLPPVLGEKVKEPRDLGEPLRRVRHVLA